MKKRILSIITALALTIALLPAAAVPARAAGIGHTVQVSDSDTFNSAIENLQDGDTIQLTNSFEVTTPTSSNDSLFIGKAVTIDGQGYQLTLRYAGVLLGADVTFKNVSLGLASNVRPAIMANGHTLILEGVTRAESCRNINLFCGGQTGATQGDLSAQNQGLHGQIIIKGNTYLGPTGRIFAGSISTDGTNNEFTLPATVTIEESVTGDAIGELYACGALETYTSTDDWFDYQNEINPPFASPGNFKVREQVTFNLYQSKVRKVSGDTGIEGNLAQVNYKGTNYLNDNLVLSSIGGLTVESGNLAPAAGQLEQKNASTEDRTSEIVSVSGGSCFSSTSNAHLSITSGATLGLQKLGDVTVGDFTGGGFLILHQNQTLSISGAVTGTASVAVGGVSFNGLNSTTLPVEGHTYIAAPNSQDGAFVLLPYSTKPDMKLVRDDSGNWTVPAQTVGTSKLQSLAPADTRVDSGETEITVPMNTSYTGDELGIDAIPLTIRVNGAEASFNTDDEYYEAAGLHLYVGDTGKGEECWIYAASSFSAPVPDGSYRIEIVVPGAYTVSGADLTASFTLTVGNAIPEPVSIPIPQAISGLVWTGAEQTGVNGGTGYTLTGHRATAAGSYTATATLASGCRWEDGTTDPKSIPWTIARVPPPPLPPGFQAWPPPPQAGPTERSPAPLPRWNTPPTVIFPTLKPAARGKLPGLPPGLIMCG